MNLVLTILIAIYKKNVNLLIKSLPSNYLLFYYIFLIEFLSTVPFLPYFFFLYRILALNFSRKLSKYNEWRRSYNTFNA